MSRQTNSRSKSAAAPGSGLSNPATMTASPHGSVGCEQVERLAYSYWQSRGCPHGSPEEDWFRAEEALNGTAE